MAQFEKIPQGLKPEDFISRIFGTTEVVPCYKAIQTEPVTVPDIATRILL
jgi:hypothetical protein